jgi:hypothetical protein
MSAQRSRKTAAKTPEKRAQPHGGALYQGGVRGNRGGTGRPQIAFKAECESICNALLLPAIRAYLAGHDPADPGYRWAADKMLEYGQGRPVQRVEGADGKPLLVVGGV